MPAVKPLTVHSQFPGYPVDTLPDLTGLEDCSWHNDTCPSWRSDQYIIWIDWPDNADREAPGGPRFIVVRTDDDGYPTGHEPELETDDWAEVQAYLNKEKTQ